MSEAYADWTAWHLSDIIEYADQLAQEASLTDEERISLRENMWSEAGYDSWNKQGPKPRCADYPYKPDRPKGLSVQRWLEAATAANRPIERPTWDERLSYAERNLEAPKWAAQGDGLTRRWVLKRGPFVSERRGRLQSNPFSFEASSIYYSARALLWRTGHFEYQPYDGWIGPKGMNEPHVGLYWFYMRIVRWRAACNHFSVSMSRAGRSRAMFCALRLGQTFTEMELRAAHNEPFTKAQRTREAQADSARARRKGSREQRQEAWWKFRRMGYSAVKAGEQAGTELGCSERTIRRAFDDEYPETNF